MKKKANNHRVLRIAIATLTYLRDHPSSKDTAKGIAKWWVGEEENMVEEALELLIKERVMEKRGQIYQLAPDGSATQSKNNIENTLRWLRKRKWK